METDENMRCPKCKRIAVALVSQKGKGKKICRDCKREVIYGKAIQD